MNWNRLFLLAALVGLLPKTASAQSPTRPDAEVPAARVVAVREPLSTAWPMRVLAGPASLRLHRPEFLSWSGEILQGRFTVAVQRQGASRDAHGSVSFTARALAMVDGRTTAIDQFAFGDASFPLLPEASDAFVVAMREALAGRIFLLDTDRLRNEVEIAQAGGSRAVVSVGSEPVRVIYREEPTVLVSIDGEPAMREMPGTPWLRVINTRAFLVLDAREGRYFLWARGRWYESTHVAAPWRAAAHPPAGLDTARGEAATQGSVDAFEQEDGTQQAAAIVVATTPTELLQSDGPPRYVPVGETRLLQLVNSPNRIFMEMGSRTHYALLAGRWYRSADLRGGSWEPVAPDQLSAEFRRIPPDHAAADVLAAVPDTPAARDAIIANRVPRMATVSRSHARLEVKFDGDAPVFEPIAGTSLQRVVNAPLPIISVPSEGFFALDRGLWFRATTPQGPWTLANWVPTEIYAIPPESPLYYVTYARVYDAQDDTLYTGYTAGYTGSFVTTQNVVVYGPPRCYRPWIGWYWYAGPCGWGYGFSSYYSWHDSWNRYYIDGYHYHPRRHFYTHTPWWGPWRPIDPPRVLVKGRRDHGPDTHPAPVRGPMPVERARTSPVPARVAPEVRGADIPPRRAGPVTVPTPKASGQRPPQHAREDEGVRIRAVPTEKPVPVPTPKRHARPTTDGGSAAGSESAPQVRKGPAPAGRD